jgi:flavin-dependent dehydrogenase
LNRSITISGAGPAGLAAAISLAHAGWRVAVLERHAHVGLRFHGDFQGIENWTGDRDALEELATYGIRSELGQVPFREATYFSPGGREYTFRSEAPWFYLVRRGTDEGTLDFALRSQALAEGVQIQFNTTGRHLPEGGIVAEGPRRADAVAVGHVFETDLADGAFCAVADNLAPKGYAYLLIHRGRGTVATCLFRDFHMEKAYLARTVDFFQAKAGLRMRNPRFFGGSGNLLFPPVGRRARLL